MKKAIFNVAIFIAAFIYMIVEHGFLKALGIMSVLAILVLAMELIGRFLKRLDQKDKKLKR